MNIFKNLNITRPYKEEKITINKDLLSIYEKPIEERTNKENEILFNTFQELPFFFIFL